MVQELSENNIKDQYELYNRINNQTRRQILVFVYQGKRNYTELKEFTNLKPGSLYHHLGVLKPLIAKIEHGQYKITEIGKIIVESLDYLPQEGLKPSIEIIDQKFQENEDQIGVEKSGQRNSHPTKDNILSTLWLYPTNVVFISILLVIQILLGLEGVAFAGSAIYAVGTPIAFFFDFFAILLGIGVLYLVETILYEFPIYSKMKFITFIRIISMFPGAIIGISLLLLFRADLVPGEIGYSIIFAIALIAGTLLAASGIHYLRGEDFSKSILIAICPALVDLLLGIVVLVSL